MPWYALNVLYLIIWSALLIHCLFRSEFHPILGRKWRTKIFWLLTFVFFNPLLTFVYFVLGFLLRPPKAEQRGKSIGLCSVVAIVCVCVVLALFEWPLGGYDAEPVVILSQSGEDKPPEQNEPFRGFEAHVGMMEAK
jgi:formate hydrogenlyase subunit 3/multisubunit Na+/H+ antiporter MnhD subunit